MTGGSPLSSLRSAIRASASAEILGRVAALAVTIVSARLLEPAELGTLGLVIAGIAIISMLGGYVEAGALVATRKMDEGVRATVGGVLRLIVVGVPLLFLFLFQEAILSAFLKDGARQAQARSLLPVLALLPVIEAISGVAAVVLQRRMLLAPVAIRQAYQPFIYAAGGLSLVVLGFGTMGLAWAQITGAAAVAAVMWNLARTQGALAAGANVVAFRAIGTESLKQATAGFVGFLTERVDNLLVAGTLGPAALSFYSFAWSASRLPVTIVSRVARGAFLPALVHAKGQLEESRRILAMGLSSALGLSMGLGTLIGLFGSEVVTLVVGSRWASAGACLELMAATVAVSPLLFLPLAALQAGGAAHRGGPVAATLQLGLQLILIPPLCVRFGERGAAAVDFIAFSAAAFVVVWWTRQFGTPGAAEILRMLKAPAMGLVCAVAPLFVFGATRPTSVLGLVIGLSVGSALYLFGFRVLGRGRFQAVR